MIIDVFELVDVAYSWRCQRRVLTDGTWARNDSKRISPCFCMTWRNLITTLETGRTRTWRFPRFSALYIACKDLEKKHQAKKTLITLHHCAVVTALLDLSARPLSISRPKITFRVSLRTLIRTMIIATGDCCTGVYYERVSEGGGRVSFLAFQLENLVRDSERGNV